MLLDQRINYFKPQPFQLSAAGLLGTTAKWPIDRTWPIEEIILQTCFTVTAPLTLVVNPQTPDQFDNILQLVQHFNLSVNDGKQPRSVIDLDGIDLLETATIRGLNMDFSTLYLGALQKMVTIPNGAYVLTHRIPMVDSSVGEPLRSRLYLPVHTYPQDPVLSITYQSLANIATAGVIGSITTDVQLVRRVPTATSEALLRSKPGSNPNGYIDWDWIMTPFSVAPGVGTEQRFPLPLPGQYMYLVMRQYLGGANMTRNVIDNSGIGSTVGTGFGQESRWRLESGSVVLREWEWRHLKTLNEFSKIQNAAIAPTPIFVAITSAGAVTTALPQNNNGIFTPDVIAGTNFRPACTTSIDFLGDGLTGDTGTELGSLLDCNAPANSGLKMELIGTPVSVATNASYLKVSGRRLFGDLSRWQKPGF